MRITRLTCLLPAFGAVLLFGFGWGAAEAVSGGVETLLRRQITGAQHSGAQHWGDRTATLAAVMRGRIEASSDLFVVSRMLGLYRETGTLPPTRFPFVIHLWAGYAPIDGLAEITRIMATRPRFVVVDDLWLPGGPRGDAGQAHVLDRLQVSLAQEYVAEGHTGRFTSWRGGFVGGGVGATVFRRRNVPLWRPAGNGLLYDPLPLSPSSP